MGITRVELWDRNEFAVPQPAPNTLQTYRDPDIRYVEIIVHLEDASMFGESWYVNSWTEGYLCSGAPEQRVLMTQPSFGSEHGRICTQPNCSETRTDMSTIHSIAVTDDSETVSVFLPVWGEDLRLSREVALPGGGLTWDVSDHDLLAAPADICFSMVVARGVYPLVWGQMRTPQLVVDGQRMAELLSSRREP